MTDSEYTERIDAWVDPGGPTMIKAVTSLGDPVELNETELRAFIQKLIECLRQSETDSSLQESLFLEMTRAEALVIGNLLARRSEFHGLQSLEKAEVQALDNLECVIERLLVEPFKKDYDVILAEAKGLLTSEK